MINIQKLFEVLYKTYGKQNWWPADTPFEVCVGAILTQNTNWQNVEKAIKNLKEKKLLSPETILNIDDNLLQELIKPAGFFRQKARYLKNLSNFLIQNGGIEKIKERETTELRKKLLKIKGIGKETADSILLYAFNKPSFVIDKYTKRLFKRLGITASENIPYDALKNIIEKEIEPNEPNINLYKEFHALIVEHCKKFCKKKPLCESCPLSDICYNKARF